MVNKPGKLILVVLRKDYTSNFIKTDLNFFFFLIIGHDFFFDFCRLAVDANERCLIDAHNNAVINLNINASFLSSRQK